MLKFLISNILHNKEKNNEVRNYVHNYLLMSLYHYYHNIYSINKNNEKYVFCFLVVLKQNTILRIICAETTEDKNFHSPEGYKKSLIFS